MYARRGSGKAARMKALRRPREPPPWVRGGQGRCDRGNPARLLVDPDAVVVERKTTGIKQYTTPDRNE